MLTYACFCHARVPYTKIILLVRGVEIFHMEVHNPYTPVRRRFLNHAQGIDFKRSGPQQWRAQQEGVGTCISWWLSFAYKKLNN